MIAVGWTTVQLSWGDSQPGKGVTVSTESGTGEGAARDRLLQAAAELFGRHGYAGTSLQMIADRVGVRKGAIYHHFHTREDLLAALVAPVVDALEQVPATTQDRKQFTRSFGQLYVIETPAGGTCCAPRTQDQP